MKAILFDMDGVLIDSYEVWIRLFNATMQHFGFKRLSKKQFDMHVWANDIGTTAKKYLPGVDVEDIKDYFYKHFTDYKKHMIVFPGLKEMFLELKKRKIKTALLTNTPIRLTRKTLKSIGMSKTFDLVLGFGDVKHAKPAPDMILKACKRLKVDVKDAVLVGDTRYDMLAGRRAGCKTVGIGVKGNKQISDVRELVNLLDKL